MPRGRLVEEDDVPRIDLEATTKRNYNSAVGFLVESRFGIVFSSLPL